MTRLPFKSAPSPAGGFAVTGPTFYRGSFELSKCGDTWFDMRGWTKGVVWVNGHNLGRYWWIGPQQTLYVPGPWLRQGRNDIVVLELLSTRGANLAGLREPILDDPRPEPPIAGRAPRPKLAVAPSPLGADLVGLGSFRDQVGPQDVSLEPRKGRYVAFRVDNALDGSNYATCAELMLLGEDGKPLSRRQWRVLYADSEEVDAEDGRAENLIDDDPGTIWHTEWSKNQPRHPHMVVLDLGASQLVTGARYLPRTGTVPGRSKGYAFYLSDSPFGARQD
jgi:beta-galactosidase